MTETPLLIDAYPRAIVHVDGDAFFTSVEESLDPSLRGKPLVTGLERGIVACANYPAKALGIKRGVPLHLARERCPTLRVVPSDYESYSLFSTRMFNIMRTFTPTVEAYSIDEAFADITGMRRVFHASYPDIARRMKAAIEAELGITVSIGLSLSKSLAKLGSKFRKPDGFTAIEGRHLHLLLARTPLDKVWGFGANSVSLLQKHGLGTALDYVRRPESWAARLLHKPGREIWQELRGRVVWELTTEEKTDYATILKSKTFAPPSRDRELIFAMLVRNLEGALEKARRHRLRPRLLAVVLRRQDFQHDGLEARLNRATATTLELLPLARHLFEQTVQAQVDYRATMVILGHLERDADSQLELFEDRPRIDRMQALTLAVDAINARYGRRALCAGTALSLGLKPRHDRDTVPPRYTTGLPGETATRRLGIPRLDIKV